MASWMHLVGGWRVLALGCIVGALSGAEDMAGDGMTHRMMLLVIQVGLILFCAKLGNLLFERLRLPGALGELSIGALIGPFALGAIVLVGFPEGVFPAVSPELNGLATIASVVLLFTIGLETDLTMLLRYSLAGGVTGVGGLVFSFAAGAGVVVLFSHSLFGISVGFLSPPALLLGTVTTATSVGLTARILAEKRGLDAPEGVTILSAAVIDDVLGIVLLALVMSYITASGSGGQIDWGHIAVIAFKAVGVWLVATVLGILASRRISALLKLFRDRTTIAVMALGLALLLAGLFEEAGLAMIVGAYVMGLSLSQADISHVVQDKLTAIYAFLVPIFFCVIGMRIDFHALAQPSVLLFGFVYALLALAAKVFGCGLPALLVGFNLRGAARIGFGMAPRCEVALIIVGIGLANGLLVPRGMSSGGEQIFAAVVIMILVNTILAPPVLVALLRNPAAGVRHPVHIASDRREAVFDFPTIEIATFFIDRLNALMEEEGFFVHCIDRRRQLFQLRKDAVVIDYQRDGTTLRFRCRSVEMPLLDAAMYECLAALEHTLQGLRKPLDAAGIQRRLQGTTRPGEPSAAMLIGHFLDDDCIVPELAATTKTEAIDELLAVLAACGRLTAVDQARTAVWEREESLSTGLRFGVAIPHARIDVVRRMVCAVGIARQGIDFSSLDGEPTRIVILTLSPASRPSPYLQFMAMISRNLDEAGRARLLRARTPADIRRALCRLPLPAARDGAGGTTSQIFDPTPYLDPALVCMRLASESKEGAIRELTDLLVAQDRLTDREEALRVVLEREAQLSTGLGSGVALPHGRSTVVDRLVCAIGLAPQGIDFEAADGRPTQVVLLVLTPPTGVDPYLHFVAWVIRTIGSKGMDRLLACEDGQEVCDLLLGRDPEGRQST